MAARVSTASVVFRNANEWKGNNAIATCARQLRAGRLALVLGAGASAGYGLPMWGSLLKLMFEEKKTKMPAGKDLATLGDDLLNRVLKGNENALTQLVGQHLYPKSYKPGLALLKKYGLLTAIASITMGRRRGRVRHIVNFNLDNVLESCFTTLGYDVEVISDPSQWPHKKDISVIHPHGFLPHKQVSKGKAIFARLQMEQLNEETPNSWRRKLYDVMSTHTCLFIGLSGDDYLFNLLTAVNSRHLGLIRGDAYMGIRFAKASDPNTKQWRDRKVAQFSVRTWNKIPDFLFEVCQHASEL